MDELAIEIRDQLVDGMREELYSCPDPIVYATDPELDEVSISWDDNTPDGLIITTDRGKFRVAVSVVPIQA